MKYILLFLFLVNISFADDDFLEGKGIFEGNEFLAPPLPPLPALSSSKERRKLHVFLNDDIIPEMENYETFLLISETLEGNFEREKEKILHDIDCGFLKIKDVPKVYEELHEKLANLRKDLVVLEDSSIECPYYTLFKYDPKWNYFQKFYELSGKEREIKYPSDVLMILSLEKKIMELTKNAGSRTYHSNNWLYSFTKITWGRECLIQVEPSIYKGGLNEYSDVSFHMYYFTIDFANIREPYKREMFISISDNNTMKTSIEYQTVEDLQRKSLPYVKFVDNNTSYNLKKEIVEIEMMLVPD